MVVIPALLACSADNPGESPEPPAPDVVEAAAAAYQRFLETAPNHAQGWFDYAGLLVSQGKPSQAIEALSRSLAAEPNQRVQALKAELEASMADGQ